MGLQHIGEGSVSSGGLAAVNTASGEAAIYEVPTGISAIQRAGDIIMLGTGEGIYILNAKGEASPIGPDVDEAGDYKLQWE